MLSDKMLSDNIQYYHITCCQITFCQLTCCQLITCCYQIASMKQDNIMIRADQIMLSEIILLCNSMLSYFFFLQILPHSCTGCWRQGSDIVVKLMNKSGGLIRSFPLTDVLYLCRMLRHYAQYNHRRIFYGHSCCSGRDSATWY
jgi:hypothetical protein